MARGARHARRRAIATVIVIALSALPALLAAELPITKNSPIPDFQNRPQDVTPYDFDAQQDQTQPIKNIKNALPESSAFVAIKVAVNVPAAVYVCEGERTVDVPPSPKVQAQLVGEPLLVSVKFTTSGALRWSASRRSSRSGPRRRVR